MGLAGNPIDLEGKLRNLLARALKSGARQREEVLPKDPFQWAVVSIYCEFGQAVEVERTFRYSPLVYHLLSAQKTRVSTNLWAQSTER